MATIECNHLSTICKLCSRHTFARRRTRFCVSWINHYMHRRFAHRANEVAQIVAGCFAIYMFKDKVVQPCKSATKIIR